MKIVIIDIEKEKRRKIIYDNIKDFENEIYYLQYRDKTKKIIKCGTSQKVKDDKNCLDEISIDTDFDLCLIHGGDRLYKDLVKYKKRIWYSGFSGEDNRLKAYKYDERIISEKECFLQQDAKELIEYSRRQLNGENPEKPDILLPPKTNEYTYSLKILCELFIVVWYENNKKKHKDLEMTNDSIFVLLKELKWIKFRKKKDNLSYIKEVEGKLDIVSDPGWWRDIFDNEKILKNELKKELELDSIPEEINSLISSIFEKNIEIDIVLKGYIKLKEFQK